MESRLRLRYVLVTYLIAAQSLKMIGLLLASYRTDGIPCSRNTCAFTAAHACTSPQPTMSSGPWVLESAWDHSQASTAYPWLKEPRPRACEHSTRVGKWQGRTCHELNGMMAGRYLEIHQKLQQGLIHDNAEPTLSSKLQPLMPACNQSTFWMESTESEAN